MSGMPFAVTRMVFALHGTLSSLKRCWTVSFSESSRTLCVHVLVQKNISQKQPIGQPDIPTTGNLGQVLKARHPYLALLAKW